MSWWGVHKILVILSHVWESTCHHFCRMNTFQWWRLPVIWDQSGRMLSLCWILLIWLGYFFKNLIYHWCYHFCEVFCELLRFILKIFPGGFNCSLNDEYLVILLVIHIFFHSGSWTLRYEGQDHRNRAMGVIWCYMARMSINEKITWWNQCIRHVISVE